MVRSLTMHSWPPNTLVRDASIAVGLDSKAIERHQAAIHAALTQLFGRATTLEGLGIVSTNSKLQFHGPLTLHFADGTKQDFSHLHHEAFITASELDRAISVTTSASRVITVENTKTTFRNLLAANRAQDALIIATSFPTRAVDIVLRKLPQELPHHHFGDTDPAGYQILLKLRQICSRPVHALGMDWQDAFNSPALTDQERGIIHKLLASTAMTDRADDLSRMLAAGRRGQFEQECRPLPLVANK
jgi:hypothetical protein